ENLILSINAVLLSFLFSFPFKLFEIPTTTNAFCFKDRMKNLFYENSERVYDLMKDVLTEITDPNIVLETIANRKSY
ncbi:uncharacterized protein B0P05DRAFT_232415, partial [Gilbertella persicaria]|uniref:uncharacterized protein n=1 Tax=Gilbertella persicaria TaxID=101096 RepID=UPI00221F42F9